LVDYPNQTAEIVKTIVENHGILPKDTPNQFLSQGLFEQL
jgi:hypothetical protein